MKKLKKTVTTSDDLIIDDRIKVAGVMYRIDLILPGPADSTTVYAYNIRRPKIRLIVTFERNTLVHIWNQK